MSLSRYELQQTDEYLTRLSLEYANRPDSFIASQAAPVIPTEGLISGIYRKFKLGNMFKVYNDIRARLSLSQQALYEMDTDGTFKCLEHALHDGIADRDKDEFIGKGIDLVDYAVRVVTDSILLGREYRVATLLTTSGNYGANTSALTGNDRWDVASSGDADPFEDIETMRNAIHAGCGKEMNTMILGRQVFYKCRRNPFIIDSVKYTMAAKNQNLTPELLAQAFGVDRVLIGHPLYVTTKEGQAETLGYVWGKNAIGAYIDPNPTNRTSTLAAIFSRYNTDGVQMRKWYNDDVKGTYVEGWIDEDEKIIDSKCGYLLQTVVS
jgi:hypothetical protein